MRRPEIAILRFDWRPQRIAHLKRELRARSLIRNLCDRAPNGAPCTDRGTHAEYDKIDPETVDHY